MQKYLDKKVSSLEEREREKLLVRLKQTKFQKRMKQVRLINVKEMTKKSETSQVKAYFKIVPSLQGKL